MEGETLPRFDSKSRMFGNVKYPREHRIPGYTQKAVFFHLEIVTRWASLRYYTVLVYVSVLVGAVHFRLFPLFPHVFRCQVLLLDTIYCVHTPHCTYMQCACLLPRPPAYLRPCAPARARVCGRVCAWARARAGLLPLFASFYSPIMYILRRYARPARRVVRSAHSAANFFEIVFKPSISIPLSSAGVGGTILYCYTG